MSRIGAEKQREKAGEPQLVTVYAVIPNPTPIVDGQVIGGHIAIEAVVDLAALRITRRSSPGYKLESAARCVTWMEGES